MSSPTISAVIANYNHARFLPTAIEEIVNQTRPPDEFLILDDASTDNSVQVIEQYARQHDSIRVLRNATNAGVNAAHRRLFEATTGDYVYAGAADDRRYPEFLERTLQMAVQHPAAGLICGKMAILDADNNELGEMGIRRWAEPTFADPQRVLEEFLNVESPSHSLCTATVYRREALREVGWYQDDLEFWGDTFSARAIALKFGMCYLPERLAGWRRLRGSFSGTGRTDHRHMLDLIAQAAAKMRSETFRDRFPESHIQRWEKRYRRLTIWNAWLGEGIASPANPKTWWRALTRLHKLPGALRLSGYRPGQQRSNDEIQMTKE